MQVATGERAFSVLLKHLLSVLLLSLTGNTFKDSFIYLFMFDCAQVFVCCMGFPYLEASGDCSLVAALGFLIAVASFVGKHKL